MANGDDLGFVPTAKTDDLGFVPAKKALTPQATIGPDKRGLLQRANDWWVRKPAYEGTLDSPGRSPREKAQDIGKGAAVASLPLLGGGLAMAPGATLLGLGGGAVGGYAGGKAGEWAGEQVGAPDLGGDIGGLAGSLFGGYAGAKGARPLGNKAASWFRNPATPSQAAAGTGGTVKDILPPNLQKWTLPPWLVPKGEIGTPTNPGEFSKIPSRLTKAQVAAVPDQFTGAPKPNAPTTTPSRLDISQLPEPVQRFQTENPGYMASVPRKQLLGLAGTGKLGAGEQLQQLGQRVLYTPRGVISGEKVRLPWESKPIPFEAPTSALKMETDSLGIRWAVSPDGYRVSIPKSVPDEGIAAYATPKLAEQADIHGKLSLKKTRQ